MLTDTEVAVTARQALADELTELTPPADLLAHVRAQHAQTLRRHRTAAAAAAAVTAGLLATAIIAGTGATAPGPQPPVATRPASGPTPARQQTLVLDGLTIKVKPPLRVTAGAHPAVEARLAGKPRLVKWLLFSGTIPAAATRIRTGTGEGYVLKTAAGPSLYVPFQATGQMHYLVLSFGHISESQLARFARSITVAGKPG